MRPIEINVKTASRCLDIVWEDGTNDSYAFALLRERCLCAECRSAAIRGDGKIPAIGDDVVITGIEPVGNYAIQLVFSDRHDRGIYPFSYLRELAQGEVQER